MAHRGANDGPYLGRIVVLVGGCTLVLTASFVGVLALVDGVREMGSRLPAYVVAMAVAFVATVVVAEHHTTDGRDIITQAAAVALAMFVVALLGGEGVVYALGAPDRVLASQLLLYFLSAGLIGTGLGYWGMRHWRELLASGPGL